MKFRILAPLEKHELDITYVTSISYPIEDEFFVTVQIPETKIEATLSYKKQSGTRTLIGVSGISSYGPRKEIKSSQLNLPLIKIRNEITTLIQELSDSVSVTIRPETIRATASVSFVKVGSLVGQSPSLHAEPKQLSLCPCQREPQNESKTIFGYPCQKDYSCWQDWFRISFKACCKSSSGNLLASTCRIHSSW